MTEFNWRVKTPYVALKSGGSSIETAFGELAVAEPTARVNMQFPYNINSRVAKSEINNGATITQADSMAIVQSGTSANSSARLISRRVLHYNPGQGAEVRFTAIFTEGVAGSQQVIGVGDVGDGFFFGYDGTDFNVCRRRAGNPHLAKMTVTAAATGTGNITITLDGDTQTVAVTSGDAAAVVARKIAAVSFANIGTGWQVDVSGETVEFLSFDAAAHGGSYSVSGQGVTATFANTVTGVAPTDDWTPQSSWNGFDTFDGTGVSGVTLDPTKGNVYRIAYQWLGFGAIRFYIEEPATGSFVEVHRIVYANQNTVPSVYNPTFPLYVSAINHANTTNMTLKTASMVGMVQGKEVEHGERFGADASKASVTTEVAVLTIRVKEVYQSRINRTHIFPDLWSGGGENSGGKTINFRLLYNATLGGTPSYSDIDTNTSVVEVDTSATTVTGGFELLEVITVGGTASQVVQLDTGFHMAPGDTLTVSAQSSQTSTAITSFGWIEEI